MPSSDDTFGFAARVALFALPAIVFAVVGWEFRWMCDDAFINLRVVENVFRGYGPVFNAGERVEAFTSPLWVAVLSALRPMTAALPWVAVVGGLAGSVLGILFAQFGAVRLRGHSPFRRSTLDRNWWVPAGTAIYCALPVAWHYGTSGLENGLGLLWLGGTFWAVASLVDFQRDRAPSTFHVAAPALLAGLGPLVRPELGLFAVAFLTTVLAVPLASDGERAWRRVVAALAAAAAIPVAYQIFRMGYYVSPLPNTAVAKAAFGSRWAQGLYYAIDFFGRYGLPVPLGIVALAWQTKFREALDGGGRLRALAVAAPVIAGLLHCLYVIRLGGGFMHGRLFLPALFGMLTPVAAVAVPPERLERTRFRLAAGTFAVWALLAAFLLRPHDGKWHGINDERQWYVDKAGVENPVTLADYSEMFFVKGTPSADHVLGEICSPAEYPSLGSRTDDLAFEPTCPPSVYVDRKRAGRLDPWYSFYPLRDRVVRAGNELAVSRIVIGMKSLTLGMRTHVVDRAGLASPIAARLELKARGRPGHERRLPNAWFVGRFAEPVPGEPPAVTAAREALDCGRLRELDRAVTGPITPDAFVANLARSLQFYGLTIPRDPERARETFCGGAGDEPA